MPKSGQNEKTYFALTIDVDPDVNLPVKGRTDAISHPAESDEVRLDSCKKGLEAVVSVLGNLDIKATFFFEGRTAKILTERMDLDLKNMLNGHEIGSHTFKHEDILGLDTGIPLNRRQIEQTLNTSMDILRKIFDSPITGFRAPYVRTSRLMSEVLVGSGFKYDSSVTVPWDVSKTRSFRPFNYFGQLGGPNSNESHFLIEVPLPDWILPDGKKISSYLWPIIEGDLSFSDYKRALKHLLKLQKTDSIVLLATHPWHLVETYNKGVLPDSDQKKLLDDFTSVLESLINEPDIQFVTISDYLSTKGKLAD